MHGILAHLVTIDHAISEVGADLRWAPLTALFVVASAWWVKGPLFVAAGLLRDLRARVVPITAIAISIAVVAGDVVSSLLKQVFDRTRPPLDDALVPLPGSPSFPSGHATTAFAAAATIAILCPRLRAPAFALAAIVACSRVYLGVHYTFDIVAGALLGTLVGVAVGLAGRRAARAVAPAPVPAL